MRFPYDRSDFISFLLAAKRSTYAAGGGDIDSFHRIESIARSGVRVYELHYSGGWLR
jgi:hypothetical protein